MPVAWHIACVHVYDYWLFKFVCVLFYCLVRLCDCVMRFSFYAYCVVYCFADRLAHARALVQRREDVVDLAALAMLYPPLRQIWPGSNSPPLAIYCGVSRLTNACKRRTDHGVSGVAVGSGFAQLSQTKGSPLISRCGDAGDAGSPSESPKRGSEKGDPTIKPPGSHVRVSF